MMGGSGGHNSAPGHRDGLFISTIIADALRSNLFIYLFIYYLTVLERYHDRGVSE